MAKCKTDCLERPLSLAFEKLGCVVGRYPYVFLLLSSFVAAVLGAGFIFLQERKANDIEDQFTPVNGPAKMERAFVVQNFPPSEEFSPLRLSSEGTYASLIITDLCGKNILTEAAFNDILELDRRVKNITTGNTFQNLCAKTKGNCTSNPILDIINYNATAIVSSAITYPKNNGIFLGAAIGGVALKPDSSEISSAKAVRLFYFLDEEKTEESSEWLKGFLELLSNYTQPETVHVSYFTSVSRQNELETNSDSIIPLFSVTYFLAITISILSCSRLDPVRTKVWVAAFGVVSAGLAVLAGFGLLLFCGVPFAMTVATAPFLILGIGVDDMFIMISCWQKTEVDKAVEVRLAETYKEAGVSITITTLTDVLAFYIGLLTPFRSVQSFCMYTSTALLFCYVFNITFFGACLAFNGRREKGNRHWLTCMRVPEVSGGGKGCCAGGAFDKDTRKEFDMPMDSFFKKYYGPFLTRAWVKALVCLIYAGYLAVSIYGCLQMQEGLDLKHLAVDGSYVADYYHKEDEYFSDFGPNVMLVIKDERFQYWKPTARKSLDLCLERFQNLTMADSGTEPISWLHEYVRFGQVASIDVDNEAQFKSNLTVFLNCSGFSQDVNFTNNHIHASRLFVQTVNVRTAIDEKNMLNAFRDTAAECGKLQTPVDLIAYHPAFIYFDQYAVIVTNTIQNVVVATGVMLVISLPADPKPALLSLGDVRHRICHCGSGWFHGIVGPNEKAVDAVAKLGYPIVQGAMSTIAGVVVLAAAQSYIFRTFFKIMFLVILFGAVHGVAFIPVFLTFIGTCSDSRDKKKQTLPQRSDSSQKSINAFVIENHWSADPDCP
ncbi:hypothetical protein QQF64_036472 [Cirrhinus molitorella]|uniref:SSD domain-containing protein n=1 Tax=Cirrhinus molitorella TaxID=172907 RepID=A0ABR3NIW3_9TELE